MISELIYFGVKGQALIDAVEKVADEAVVEKKYVRGKDVFNIGQTSGTPYKQLIVTANSTRNINPFAVYTEVAVMAHRWPRPEWVQAIGFGPESVKAAIQDFAERLKAELIRGIG
jgi:hypothetical protein